MAKYQRKTERINIKSWELSPLPQKVSWLFPDGRGELSFGPHKYGFEGPFVFIDTETTGFDADEDAVLTIACLVWENGQISNRREIFLNPGTRRWKDAAVKVHGITKEEADRFPPATEGLKTLNDMLAAAQDAVFVAHNLPFDRKMLRGMYHHYDIDTPQLIESAPQFDTMIWCQRFGLPKKLGDAVKAAGCPVYRAHNAMSDIAMTCNLWGRFTEEIAKSGVKNLIF